VSGTAGFILPGDRVDVMLAAQYELEKATGKTEMRSFAEMLLQDVRVLAIDQNMKDVTGPDDKQQAKLATTATLEVNIRQAEVIGVANQMGKLTLVLTGLVKPEEGDEATTLADAPRFLDDVAVSRFWRAMKTRAEVSGTEITPPKPSMVVYRGTEGSVVGGKAQ
jgi:Flp pilus assembly protein CpaB